MACFAVAFVASGRRTAWLAFQDGFAYAALRNEAAWRQVLNSLGRNDWQRGGIRNLKPAMLRASYRKQIASDAMIATVARNPCPTLPDDPLPSTNSLKVFLAAERLPRGPMFPAAVSLGSLVFEVLPEFANCPQEDRNDGFECTPMLATEPANAFIETAYHCSPSVPRTDRAVPACGGGTSKFMQWHQQSLLGAERSLLRRTGEYCGRRRAGANPRFECISRAVVLQTRENGGERAATISSSAKTTRRCRRQCE